MVVNFSAVWRELQSLEHCHYTESRRRDPTIQRDIHSNTDTPGVRPEATTILPTVHQIPAPAMPESPGSRIARIARGDASPVPQAEILTPLYADDTTAGPETSADRNYPTSTPTPVGRPSILRPPTPTIATDQEETKAGDKTSCAMGSGDAYNPGGKKDSGVHRVSVSPTPTPTVASKTNNSGAIAKDKSVEPDRKKSKLRKKSPSPVVDRKKRDRDDDDSDRSRSIPRMRNRQSFQRGADIRSMKNHDGKNPADQGKSKSGIALSRRMRGTGGSDRENSQEHQRRRLSQGKGTVRGTTAE